jgi:hypothetical protein
MAPDKKIDSTERTKVTDGPIRRNKRNHGEGMAAEEDTDCLNEDGTVDEDCTEEATADGPIRGTKRTHGEATAEKEMEAE